MPVKYLLKAIVVLFINQELKQSKSAKADLYLKTYVIGNLFFKAIKNMGAKQLPLIIRTIDRWFHLLEQEQDHYYQSYGL